VCSGDDDEVKAKGVTTQIAAERNDWAIIQLTSHIRKKSASKESSGSRPNDRLLRIPLSFEPTIAAALETPPERKTKPSKE
jgi:hypothetical protein